MSSLDISSFRFDSVVLEIRYDNSYKLWDNAGRLWTQFAQQHPDMISEKVEPNLQKFTDGKSFEFQLAIDKAHISQTRPQTNLKIYSDICESYYRIVTDNLDLRALSRIGLRVQYFKVFESVEKAASDLLKTGLVKNNIGKTFNIDVPSKKIGATFRNEDDEIGARVSINTITRITELKVRVNVPDLKSQKIEESGIIYDVDYYTSAPTLVSQFKPVDWIEQSHRLIRRDSKSYLG